MSTRYRLLILLALAASSAGAATTPNLDGSSLAVGNAESVRLLDEAEALVGNMAEGQYTYDYLQFYWKRAQSDVDRIRRVYPTSPTALALNRGDVKLGPYSLDYFKTRVLYNLELKRLGSFDDVNCAIFLYGRNEARNDARRDEALSNIVEVLSRRQRWEEALRFPVLSVHRPLLLRSIYKIAAFYGVDAIARKLVAGSTPAEREAAGFDALRAEAIALQGRPRMDLYAFVDAHPTSEVKEAALRGVVEREILIRHMERTRTPFRNAIQTVHLVVLNTSLRDDVAGVASRIYGSSLDGAGDLMSEYAASQGRGPESSAPKASHLAYMQYLADSDRMDAVGTYVSDNAVRGNAREACRLKAIELYAEAGMMTDAEKARKAFAGDYSRDADEAGLAEFRGRMASPVVHFEARSQSFAELPISDPCVMAVAIMEWSLSPTRSQRGATPWDAVVARFAGGFENLPAPKSAVVGDAASTLAPY